MSATATKSKPAKPAKETTVSPEIDRAKADLEAASQKVTVAFRAFGDLYGHIPRGEEEKPANQTALAKKAQSWLDARAASKAAAEKLKEAKAGAKPAEAAAE